MRNNMRDNVRDFIYLNTKQYISLSLLQVFYLLNIIIIEIIMVLGVALIKKSGVNWKSLFPLTSIVAWNLFYATFVLTVRNKKIKKTFELRFLVNGISGLLISSLFWILYTTISLASNELFFDFDISVFLLCFYFLFSVLYIFFIVCGVHHGAYKKMQEKKQSPKVIALTAFVAALLPGAGVSGMLTSKLLRAYASENTQSIVASVGLVLMIFIPALAHINFVQYFYCKKYKIFCDEYGNAASPNLEPQIKVKQLKAKKETSQKTDNSNNSLSKKKIPLIIKILIGIVSVPLIFFIIVFIVSFIKVMIERI